MSGFEMRAMTPYEKGLMLDMARGMTAQQSADSRGLTLYQVYDGQRKIKTLLGASTISHAVALTIAFGYIDHAEVTA